MAGTGAELSVAWDEVVPELDIQFAKLRKSEMEGVWVKWHIGMILKGAFRDASYGDKIARKCGERYGLKDFREIYRWVKFATMFPSIESVERAAQDRLNGRLTWEMVRTKLLPALSVDPDQSNGVDGMAERTMGVHEWSRKQVRRMIESGFVDGHREEIVGFLTNDVQEGFDLLRQVDQSATVIVDGRPPSIEEVSYAPGDYRTFQAWVRTEPCLVCGRDQFNGDVVEFAHYPYTAGAKARTEEHRGAPLCVECHRDVHTMGIETWMQRYGEKALAWMQWSLFEAILALSKARK